MPEGPPASKVHLVNRRGARPYLRRTAPNALERGQHGAQAYAVGCRCRTCRDAYNAAARGYAKTERIEREILNGRQPIYLVSARPAVARVGELRARGASLRAIALRSGVPYESLRRLVNRPSPRTTNTHLERLLAALR